MLNNKKLIGILLGGILIVSLISYSLFNSTNNILKLAVNETVSWTGRVLSEPVNMVVRFVNSVDDLVNTFEENEALKSKIDQAYEMQVRIADLETENEKLRSQLDLSETLSEFTTVNATVISRNPDQWTETLIINAGENKKLKPNMAVMAGNGLVGRVIEVYPTSAKVLLLMSQKSKDGMVSARIQTDDKGASAIGVLSEYDPQTKEYLMTQVSPDAKVKKGNMVITSGLGGVIPSTLLIGEVTSTQMDNYGLFQIVRIKPAGEMTDIRFVTVIQRAGEANEKD
ncbi:MULTISPECIES: rod shape-determining protein MreC [Facklamia]|uniref:rod shape-determining protein MreC n=1 Tax=Facklamia TaxID=66831 RepID=UPI0008A5753D|nr:MULTISPECIES: rod shape-determining protein MreC [Facklamia]OFL65107.1 rod shape-determining protein MreC [Facklamia sp. HMSC062C11]RYC98923.1 rod shape-determining protein MreC [Facklamia hominis]